MRITANPVGCPTCTAMIGDPCVTRTGNLAARPHKARLEADIPLGRHTHDCRAHAIGCAAENIGEWDDATRATEGTDPVQVGDGYLADGIASCLCWSAGIAWATPWIIRGAKFLANAIPTYTTVQVDEHGAPVTAAPERSYQTETPALAAGYAARNVITGDYWTSRVESTDVTPDGGTWTYTPRVGSPVRIRVTIEPGAALRAPTAVEPEPVVDYVTIDPTSRNWAAAFAMSAALDAIEPDGTTLAGSKTGTASQWASALANLRDALQGEGVPPETTDNLVIRHDGDDTWLTDVDGDRRIMRVGSPSALEDAQYGMAWAYRLAGPQRISPYPLLSRSERASQRGTAAV